MRRFYDQAISSNEELIDEFERMAESMPAANEDSRDD